MFDEIIIMILSFCNPSINLFILSKKINNICKDIFKPSADNLLKVIFNVKLESIEYILHTYSLKILTEQTKSPIGIKCNYRTLIYQILMNYQFIPINLIKRLIKENSHKTQKVSMSKYDLFVLNYACNDSYRLYKSCDPYFKFKKYKEEFFDYLYDEESIERLRVYLDNPLDWHQIT